MTLRPTAPIIATPMVVDFHFHPISLRHRLRPELVALIRSRNPQWERRFARPLDQGELLAFLDEQGVDRAVILAERCPEVTGVVDNEYVAELCRGCPRLVPFCSVHPLLEPHPARALERLAEAGFRGLKLWPSYQHFFPNDPRVYPLYEVAQERGLVVMFHFGTALLPRSKLKYCDPLCLDEVARDFPEMDIVLAHAGRGFWHEEAFVLCRIHPRVYLEVSGLPPRRLPELFPRLEAVADRVLFGSDYPTVASIRGLVEEVRRLPLPPSVREAMLGGNALRLLGMEDQV